MQSDVVNLHEENKVLKEKVNDITMMLYSKIEENAHIQRKLDQALLQNQLIMTQILSSNQNGQVSNPSQNDSTPNHQANHMGMPTTKVMQQ